MNAQAADILIGINFTLLSLREGSQDQKAFLQRYQIPNLNSARRIGRDTTKDLEEKLGDRQKLKGTIDFPLKMWVG